MAEHHRELAPDNTAVFSRLIQLLAIIVFALSVTAFCLVDLNLHQGVMQALLIGVIPNITASVLIYLALYFSLSRLDSLRQHAAQRQLVDAIVAGVRAAVPAAPSPVEAVESSRLPLATIRISAEQQVVIQCFLEAMYVFATSITGNFDLRLYCHLADYDTGILHPVCVASGSRLADYDYRAGIPFRGAQSETFVIGQALRLRRVAAGDLTADHRDAYPDGLRTRIPASLQCVIAAPIESYAPGVDRMPLGTISIDCTSAHCAELGFTDGVGEIESRFDIMLKSCSRALYQVLMMDGGMAGEG
jgi:hypothetical protein